MADLMDKGECKLSHIHSVYDTDTHFKIDATTRVVKNSPETKVMIVQHDHNSERFTFEIPRYVDGHDMSTCNVVQVHYINTDATGKGVYNKGIYEVDDLQISPDDDNVVICSWLISGNATQYVGKLSFVIRFACTTGGVVDYAWNTATHSNVHISSGINNGNEIAEEYVDILEQWHEELFNGSGSSGENVDLTGYATEQWVQEGFQPKGETGVYILSDGETVDDAPPDADVVIDPNDNGGSFIPPTSQEPGYSGGNEVLCVTIQSDNDGYTADKTATEIYEAYQAGKSVVCHVIDLDGNFATNLVVCSSDIACFSASVGDVVIAVTLTENGVQVDFVDILTEDELPEISGGGISVTGASVGQTVRIAEVDENGVPTAWEAVEFPSGGSVDYEKPWKKVAEIKTTEDLNYISVTEDMDGNPLSFDEAILAVAVGRASDATTNGSYVISPHYEWRSSFNALGVYNYALNSDVYLTFARIELLPGEFIQITTSASRRIFDSLARYAGFSSDVQSGGVQKSAETVIHVIQSKFVHTSTWVDMLNENRKLRGVTIGTDLATSVKIGAGSTMEVWVR